MDWASIFEKVAKRVAVAGLDAIRHMSCRSCKYVNPCLPLFRLHQFEEKKVQVLVSSNLDTFLTWQARQYADKVAPLKCAAPLNYSTCRLLWRAQITSIILNYCICTYCFSCKTHSYNSYFILFEQEQHDERAKAETRHVMNINMPT